MPRRQFGPRKHWNRGFEARTRTNCPGRLFPFPFVLDFWVLPSPSSSLPPPMILCGVLFILLTDLSRAANAVLLCSQHVRYRLSASHILNAVVVLSYYYFAAGLFESKL